MGAKFGTDGVRGVANAELTPELVVRLGRAVARRLPSDSLLLGRDTRISGPMLSAALSAGLASEGTRVVDVGVIPTPGLAWLSARHGLPAAMISASHNPFPDNGIKLFASGGAKLPESLERAIEDEMAALAGPAGDRRPRLVGDQVGAILSEPSAVDAYADHLVSVVDGARLSGMHLVVDCACGAASSVATGVLRRLGARVDAIADQPDGTNINRDCGSTHPEALQAAVVDAGADAGLAFDGDADRLIAVDHRGELVDGDHLLCLFALDLKERGMLQQDSVVVTVMTNLGFHRAMAAAGISVRETNVGDRYVLEELERQGLTLGGEQSGHIIFKHLASTGDGILTGLLLAELVARRKVPLADLAASAMTRVPQQLVSVVVADPSSLGAARGVWEEVASVESELGDGGRVLLRPSGTEPKVRVMVEALTPELASSAVARLSQAVARELGGTVVSAAR